MTGAAGVLYGAAGPYANIAARGFAEPTGFITPGPNLLV